MTRLDPEKLTVEYRDGVTSTEPIIPRRYTLTHSDLTAELFLNIGLDYAYDKTTSMKDEVLGEWIKNTGNYNYNVYLNIDGEMNYLGVSLIRNKIFRRELTLALEAIRYGDNEFFIAHSELNSAPIYVYFISAFKAINTVEYWGTFEEYAY